MSIFSARLGIEIFVRGAFTAQSRTNQRIINLSTLGRRFIPQERIHHEDRDYRSHNALRRTARRLFNTRRTEAPRRERKPGGMENNVCSTPPRFHHRAKDRYDEERRPEKREQDNFRHSHPSVLNDGGEKVRVGGEWR